MILGLFIVIVALVTLWGSYYCFSISLHEVMLWKKREPKQCIVMGNKRKGNLFGNIYRVEHQGLHILVDDLNYMPSTLGWLPIGSMVELVYDEKERKAVRYKSMSSAIKDVIVVAFIGFFALSIGLYCMFSF